MTPYRTAPMTPPALSRDVFGFAAMLLGPSLSWWGWAVYWTVKRTWPMAAINVAVALLAVLVMGRWMRWQVR